MRIIICVKTCYGGSGIEYNRNGVYRIFSDKCIKNEGQLMYAIYSRDNVFQGYLCESFIEANFAAISEYRKTMKELNALFDEYFTL